MAITFDFLMEVLALVREYFKVTERAIMNLFRPPALNLNYVRQVQLPVFPYWSSVLDPTQLFTDVREHRGLNTVSRETIRTLIRMRTQLFGALPWNQDYLPFNSEPRRAFTLR